MHTVTSMHGIITVNKHLELCKQCLNIHPLTTYCTYFTALAVLTVYTYVHLL